MTAGSGPRETTRDCRGKQRFPRGRDQDAELLDRRRMAGGLAAFRSRPPGWKLSEETIQAGRNAGTPRELNRDLRLKAIALVRHPKARFRFTKRIVERFNAVFEL
ncbi:hypothetical protein [Burkholderia plantarii]|uniref:hypothetical protein n=1 Tax=Burkholderia plantarii TaxID=41899 RepID=UPI0018DB42E1|nr:hypothetical protein [Burkholderia plantarii]MBI0330327.1 hypothetical protein [Burkholderia plantarii]